MVLFYRVSAISIKKRRKMKEKTLASCCKYGSLYCSVDFQKIFILFCDCALHIDHFYSSQVVATHLPLDESKAS